jgi:type VI secretion system protein ImpH
VQDKFRVRIFVQSMVEYTKYLPSGDRCEPLADLVFFYVGEQLDWEVELAIPAGAIEPVRLSRFGQLGWTSWMSPNWSDTDRTYRSDGRFHPAEILKQRRRRVS